MPRPTQSARAMAIVLIAIALTGRAVYCVTPVNSDTAMFVYAGKLVEAGGLPGVDLIDNKLPSVGLLMSVPYRLFGAHWAAYGAIGLAMSILASLALARAAKQVLGPTAGWLVAVTAGVWMNFTPAVYGQLQLETITAFFSAIGGACALQLLRRCDLRDAFTLGLCAGMGMWAKPTAAAILPAIIVTVLFATRWRVADQFAALFWIATGAAIPLAVCAWIVIDSGMYKQLPATLLQLRDYSTASTADWVDAIKPMLVIALLFFPMLVLGLIFRRQHAESCVTKRYVLFAVLWFVLELGGVVAQRRMYAYHFLVLAPPTALLMGLLARRLSAVSLAMSFGPAAAIACAWAVIYFANAPDAASNPSRDDRVIQYLQNTTAPNAAVWMDDYPRLLVESDFRPGSRIPLVFLFANSDDSPQKFADAMLSDFDTQKPMGIVLWSDIDRVGDLYTNHMAEAAGSPLRAAQIRLQLHRIDAYVRSHYAQEEVIDNRTIWRLDPISKIVPDTFTRVSE